MRPASHHRVWYQHVFIATALNLLQISLGSTVNFYNPSIANFQSHRNQRNLPCVVLRTGMEGTCMFAIHCLRANGTHLGTCRDGYYFKSCCQIHDTVTTTVSSPTVMKTKSPSRRPTTTTMKPTKRHRPSTSGSETSKPTKEVIASTTKKVVRVPTTTSKPITITRRPTTTTATTLANVASSKRPTASIILTKPTRRVTETPVRPLINRNETLLTSRPPATNLQNDPISTLVTQSTAKPVPTTTTSQPFITISYVETTKSPRPKPKPTQQIVKVSPTSLDHLVELEIPLSTTQSFVSSATTITPSTLQQQHTQSSTMSVETKTESSTSGIDQPIIAYNESSAENEIKPIVGTTQPTILVTWSNIQIDNNTIENGSYTETPATPTDWILLPSVVPVETSTAPIVEHSTNISDRNSSVTQQTLLTETPAATTIAKPAETTKVPITTSTSTQRTTTHKSTSKKPPTITTKPTSKPVTTKPTSKPVTTKPTSKPFTTKPTSKPTKASTTTKITTTTETTSTTGLDSSSTQFLAPVESNKTETISSNATSSTEGPMSITSGTPIVFPTDGITESSLNNETVISGNGTANGTTPSKPQSANTMPSLEGIDYRQVCGKRMFPEPRIVGGSKASFGRWPWQISLRQWRTSTYLHKCGAALLNENWAITAAHCVDNVPPSDLLLRLGEYDLAEEEEPYGYQERRVQIVASHPQFDPRTFEYDLALLRFYEPVEFQPNIIPVCVPETDENFIGRTAFVTGWGRLYEDGPLPSVLQEVSVPVINNTICESMYRNAGYIEHIPHIFICAGWRKGGYDSCEGDSGGPMVIQRDDKRFLLAGVISWGIGCAEPNQPGVYTRISEFRDWINQILQF
ncbi:serine proteinase stubble-like isoform X2 [Bradysia coprophila]|uniref:serine proteinase stubble-like isoform X2 n=1 Tax=Bradysia coprophila TaxID=38358 RepID=UPI00187D745B|nr:serine proteinase stubble-like isoform X2 [Bradysia coprophila]